MKKILFFLSLYTILSTQYSFAQLCFSPATNFAAGWAPVFVISADFNDDGKKDLAVVDDSSNYVWVLLGTGTGSFAAADSFMVGGLTISVTIADFNGDGKLDLATANNTSNISVLLGTGTGSFGTVTNFSVGIGTFPLSITSADFNGDGKVDLATTNPNSNNILVLLGTGTGSFGAVTNFPAGNGLIGWDPWTITHADFNGDGKADLVVTNPAAHSISVLLDTGTGSFGAATNFALGGNDPVCIISADFNGDGKADLATANDQSSNVSVLLGTGTGSFGAATSFTVSLNSNSEEGLCSADFNGDGIADLAVSNECCASNGYVDVSVLLGTGTGGFGTATSFTVGIAGSFGGPEGICSADFNGDGKADLAVANQDRLAGVSILLNCTGIGIANFGNKEKLIVYPNPTTESISLNIENISNYQNSTITIQNTLGQTVKKIPFSKNIHVSDLAEGCYFLQITLSNGETYKTKFIKQ
jgi:hypothetical protein